jgi:SAM-dependent methyltransferase
MAQLSPPAVPSSLYDDSYYRQTCIGAAEWSASQGQAMAGFYPGFLARAGMAAGAVVVDIGTGRGEMLVAALERGARRAIGVEYSEAAIALARETLALHGAEDRAEVVAADARSVPLADACADLVCLADVVEHLTAAELHDALLEARRLLAPGGRIVIHTLPNRLIYSVTYPLLRLLCSANHWPANPRNEFEDAMHVNEQTVGQLRRALTRAGLRSEVTLGQWIHNEFVPSRTARRAYPLLARLGPLARFGCADIWATAYR